MKSDTVEVLVLTFGLLFVAFEYSGLRMKFTQSNKAILTMHVLAIILFTFLILIGYVETQILPGYIAVIVLCAASIYRPIIHIIQKKNFSKPEH